MSDAAIPNAEKKSATIPRVVLIISVVIFIAGGILSFVAVQSGYLFSEDSAAGENTEISVDAIAKATFVPLDPLLISLGGSGKSRHLRFTAQLEVNPAREDEVIHLLPRVVDVLNSYLRAVAVEDLEQPAALLDLRVQMLRRVNMVTGNGSVRDVLIMEFVLN